MTVGMISSLIVSPFLRWIVVSMRIMGSWRLTTVLADSQSQAYTFLTPQTQHKPDRLVRMSHSFFQNLLGDCRPRDFAVRFWDGTAGVADSLYLGDSPSRGAAQHVLAAQ